ncbi:2-methylcitrate dehydratase [Marinobacter sp. Z-F4-2]|nr:2-methylcitrate dehydratase [Marinobacter sp. Z-F4-2]
MSDHTKGLIKFASDLEYADIPDNVIERCQSLFLDWLGSAFAGKGLHPMPVLERFANSQGPGVGTSELLGSRASSSPYFASFINAASSHLVEQDDLHNSSVLHPATVVFPTAVAVAQEIGASGKDFLVAAICGYEAGIRIGEFLGLSHYRIFHTTGTVGTLAAAFTAAKLLKLSQFQFENAVGNAGTQAAGLWQFLEDGADSKQLHTAKAAADGLLSAYLAKDGFKGAKNILEGKQGLAAGMSDNAVPEKLTDRLGERWGLLETSFKYHASCRHTHPAADAFKYILDSHNLDYNEISNIKIGVHQAAIDVLGPVKSPTSIHQAKFSMGTVLGLLAVYGKAGVSEFDRYSLTCPKVKHFIDIVTMHYDKEVDSAYPNQWIGRVVVETKKGKSYAAEVPYPKGDPENALSDDEIEEKFKSLALYSNGLREDELTRFIDFAKGLAHLKKFRSFF